MLPERHTRQREAILEVLRGLKTHPTAAELHEQIRQQLPHISLGTVYRNLEILTRAGLIRKLVSGHAEARFDGDLDRHYHVRCIECGRVADVHGVSAEHVELGEVGRQTGYEILGHRVEFFGICPECGALGPSPADKAGNRNVANSVIRTGEYS